MNFFERIKIAYATFLATGGIELPSSGRSSDETIGSAMSVYNTQFGSVSPIINFEMLACLKNLWLYNPDFSQYVANIRNLGNPGHQLSVEAKSDSTIETAINRLNESASRIYRLGVGVDGLMNQYIDSLAWSGAISSEDVVNLAGRRVEKVVIVPVEQIRFRYNKETDEYDPYQRSNNLTRRDNRNALGLNPLNQETYKYLALSTVENSPYAKPPGTAAVEPILEAQKPLMENIRYMARKFGLMGFVTASIVPPPKLANETSSEYHARARTYQQAVTKALEENFSKGLLVAFRDQKIEHTNITEGATGVYDINRINEEQVFSGLGAMPGFHGRTDSTTETFADVVYYLLTAQVGNIQRIVKRRQERTYRLDLRLGGIEVDSVSLAFDKAHSRNAVAEAQARQIEFQDVLARVKAGAITPDKGAQMLGEDNWFDVELIFGAEDDGKVSTVSNSRQRNSDRKIITLSFDKRSQKYRWQPEQIEVGSYEVDTKTEGNVFPILKKKAQQA